MKLYASRAEDRDSLCVILCRNGYTVRQGAGKKDPTDKKKSGFVEVIENVSDEKSFAEDKTT